MPQPYTPKQLNMQFTSSLVVRVGESSAPMEVDTVCQRGVGQERLQHSLVSWARPLAVGQRSTCVGTVRESCCDLSNARDGGKS